MQGAVAGNMFFPPPPAEQASSKSGITTSIFPFRRSPSVDPPAYSQHDMLAARYRRLGRYVHYLRAALALVTLVCGFVVLGCAADALRLYPKTHIDPFFQLSVWPSTLDLRPTHALLACGIIIAIFSLIYFAACIAPTPGNKIHTLNIVSTPLFFLALFLSIFTTIYASSINSRFADSTTTGTLESWTCRWDGNDDSPTNFAKICSKSNIAFDFVVVLLVMEIFAVGATACGWWVESKMKKENANIGKGQIEMVA